MDENKELMHYGKLGMRWGHHKARIQSNIAARRKVQLENAKAKLANAQTKSDIKKTLNNAKLERSKRKTDIDATIGEVKAKETKTARERLAKIQSKLKRTEVKTEMNKLAEAAKLEKERINLDRTAAKLAKAKLKRQERDMKDAASAEKNGGDRALSKAAAKLEAARIRGDVQKLKAQAKLEKQIVKSEIDAMKENAGLLKGNKLDKLKAQRAAKIAEAEKAAQENTQKSAKQKPQESPVGLMTDEELRVRVARLQQEKLYKDLTRVEKSAGQKWVDSMLVDAANTLGKAVVKKGVGLIVPSGTSDKQKAKTVDAAEKVINQGIDAATKAYKEQKAAASKPTPVPTPTESESSTSGGFYASPTPTPKFTPKAYDSKPASYTPKALAPPPPIDVKFKEL